MPFSIATGVKPPTNNSNPGCAKGPLLPAYCFLFPFGGLIPECTYCDSPIKSPAQVVTDPAAGVVNNVAGVVNQVSTAAQFFTWVQANAARVGLFIVALMLVAIGLVVFAQGN